MELGFYLSKPTGRTGISLKHKLHFLQSGEIHVFLKILHAKVFCLIDCWCGFFCENRTLEIFTPSLLHLMQKTRVYGIGHIPSIFYGQD